MSNNSPKADKRFLWWSVFIGVCFGPFWVYTLVSNRSYKSLELILAIKNVEMNKAGELVLMRSLFDLICFAVCIFLCLLWYKFSSKTPKRGKALNGLGLACFMSGTFALPFIGILMEKHAGDIIKLPMNTEMFAKEVAYYPIKALFICTLLIAASYFLSFKKKEE